jgi:hypothetical protein
MFGNIMNEETDHWNPMSSNPIIPPNTVQDDIDLENEGEENGEGNGEEIGDVIGNKWNGVYDGAIQHSERMS